MLERTLLLGYNPVLVCSQNVYVTVYDIINENLLSYKNLTEDIRMTPIFMLSTMFLCTPRIKIKESYVYTHIMYFATDTLYKYN